MFPSRISISLFAVVLGCRLFDGWVAAFGRSPLPRSRMPGTKQYVASEDVPEETDETNSSRQNLMDEAVLLYSQVSRRARFAESTEDDIDILHLRGRELTSLIEDTVFDAKGIERDESTTEASASASNLEETKEPETLNDITQELDNQILLGYQATFTEEELEEWIGRIGTLQQKLQTQLAALPSTEPPEAPPAPLDKLHVRLESMRTLIDPQGIGRLRLPLARPVVRVAKAAPTGPSATPNVETKASDETEKSEVEIPLEKREDGISEIDSKEGANKVGTQKGLANADDEKLSEEVPTSQSEGEDDSDILGTTIAEDMAARTDGEEKLNGLQNGLADMVDESLSEDDASSVPQAKEDGDTLATTNDEEMATVVENDSDEDVQSKYRWSRWTRGPKVQLGKLPKKERKKDEQNAPSKSHNGVAKGTSLEIDSDKSELEPIAADTDSTNGDKGTAVDGATTVPASGAMVDLFAAEDHSELPHNEAVVTDDGIDVVSGVVTTAVLGAVVATANPLVAAGVVLGPVIRDSIKNAKNRTKKAKSAEAPLHSASEAKKGDDDEAEKNEKSSKS